MEQQSIQIKNLTVNIYSSTDPSYEYSSDVAPLPSSTVATTKSQTRFELSSDGTMVTDHKTGLMWEAGEETEVSNIEAGLEYAKQLRLGGFGDWFIPDDVDQLQSIVNRSTCNPAIYTDFFKSRRRWVYTNHKVAGSSGLVWHVHFSTGHVGYFSRDSRGLVRACRRVSPAGQ